MGWGRDPPGNEREGIALAKQRGVYRGRNKALASEEVDQLRCRAAAGEPKAQIARDFGISRETVYQYLRAPDTPHLTPAPPWHALILESGT